MSVFLQMKRLAGLTLDVFFPRWCVSCGKEGELICDKCRSRMVRLVPPLCPKCGRPQASGVLCPSCVGWNSSIDGIRSPFRFEGVARHAVHQLKYRNLRILARPLAGMMSEYLVRTPVPSDMLVPVPLHPRRLRERGYNQSGLLADALGRLTSMPVIQDGLVRAKYTPPQARTPSVERRRANLDGAFASVSQCFKDRRVLLVDDVATSAATLEACAVALKSAGAASVWGLVLAREV
jgi:competence protein ComFC